MSRTAEQTVDSLLIHADLDSIYQVAADITRWPQMLPHYRWVTVLDEHDGCRTVEMAARRDWIPVKWISLLTVDPDRHRIFYEHIGGATRGMKVEWILAMEGGAVRATIIHEMSLTAPVVRSRIGRWIVGKYFVHYIAGRTLEKIKELAEAGRDTECVEQ